MRATDTHIDKIDEGITNTSSSVSLSHTIFVDMY